VTEADLHEVVVWTVNEVFTRQEELLPPLRASIARALERNSNGPVAELDARIADLEQEILKRNRARQDYDDLGREVIRLREEKYQLQLEDAEKEGMRKKLIELEETMDEIGGQVTEYYDALVRRLIERITVRDDKYVVEFKSGIEIDVRL
jgi:flagellar biosynthesis/type III secretory pathway protein FliH